MKPSPAFPKAYKVESKPHKFCPGCGHPIVLKMLAQAIEEMKLLDKTIFLVDIGCSLLAWDFFDLPTTQTHHGRTVPTAVGLKMADPKKIVIAYVGDGGGYAIGLQHTITSCLRDNPITTIVVNNTVYAMTGGQSAPTTTSHQITTTSEEKNHATTLKGPELLQGISRPGAYLARGSTDQPLVLKQYLRQALTSQLNGHFSLVESLSACPLNWQTNASATIQRLQDLAKEFKLGALTK